MIPGAMLLAIGLLLGWETWQHLFPAGQGCHSYKSKTYDNKPTRWVGEIEIISRRLHYMRRGVYKYGTGRERVMHRA